MCSRHRSMPQWTTDASKSPATCGSNCLASTKSSNDASSLAKYISADGLEDEDANTGIECLMIVTTSISSQVNKPSQLISQTCDLCTPPSSRDGSLADGPPRTTLRGTVRSTALGPSHFLARSTSHTQCTCSLAFIEEQQQERSSRTGSVVTSFCTPLQTCSRCQMVLASSHCRSLTSRKGGRTRWVCKESPDRPGGHGCWPLHARQTTIDSRASATTRTTRALKSSTRKLSCCNELDLK